MLMEHLLSCVTGKCALRSLSLSYPKKDGPVKPHQSFFGYDTGYKTVFWYSAAFTDYILYSVSYQKKNWWGLAHQSFFWYDNDKDLKVGFPVTQLL